jgi:hypothetical protein
MYLKHFFAFSFLIIFLTAAGADPLGLTVGMELGLGNVESDVYNFAGKADPVSGRSAGLGSIMPYVNYNKGINNFLINVYLSENMILDDPQTAQLKWIVTGGYTFFFNNKLSFVTATVDNIFKLNSKDWKTEVSDGADSWENITIPTVQFTQVLGFGSVFGKFGVPVYVADIEKAHGLPEYETSFIFSDIQAGVNTRWGVLVYLRGLFQMYPDSKKAPAAYDAYKSDISFQQLDFCAGYMNGPLAGTLVFSFPIPGNALNPNGVKDAGFKLVPTVAYKINSRMQVSLRFEILNIGKDTSDPAADKIIFSPFAGFSYAF